MSTLRAFQQDILKLKFLIDNWNVPSLHMLRFNFEVFLNRIQRQEFRRVLSSGLGNLVLNRHWQEILRLWLGNLVMDRCLIDRLSLTLIQVLLLLVRLTELFLMKSVCIKTRDLILVSVEGLKCQIIGNPF